MILSNVVPFRQAARAKRCAEAVFRTYPDLIEKKTSYPPFVGKRPTLQGLLHGIAVKMVQQGPDYRPPHWDDLDLMFKQNAAARKRNRRNNACEREYRKLHASWCRGEIAGPCPPCPDYGSPDDWRAR
jgi:hypothetical protein